MTREEAIEILDRYAHHSHSEVIKYPRKVAIEAFEMAIAALKAEQAIYEEMSDRFSMTKLEAYKRLTGVIDSSFHQMKKARMIGAMALKSEPCEDAVKREAVLNTLDTMDKALDEDRTVESYKELLKECYKELPPVTPKPTECEDAVSREHLLSEIDKLMESPWFNNGKDDDMFTHYGYVERKEAVEIVRDLCVKKEPPVTPKQRWVPVSERLPEADGRYLTYIVNPYDSTRFQYIMICDCYIFRDSYTWCPDDETASDHVVAWMPLPEPYKEGESE